MWLVVDDHRQFKGDNDNIVLAWTDGVWYCGKLVLGLLMVYEVYVVPKHDWLMVMDSNRNEY